MANVPNAKNIDVLIVVGPTGIGKSRWALEEAERTGGTIINADSQQCYAACPTLTAYPSPEDMRAVPHLGYGVLQPHEQTSVGWWLNHVATHIPKVQNPIVVGGTGMYVHALLEGLSDMPLLEKATLDEVSLAMQREDWLTWARELDPTLPATMCDPQRIHRAIAILWQTGKSITAYWQERRYAVPGLKARVVVLERPTEDLNTRLEQRLENMMQAGVLDEIRPFKDGLPKDYAGIQSILGFRELMQHVHGEISLEEAKASILLRTRQYAKRQRTWFRNHIHEGKLVESIERMAFGQSITPHDRMK